MVLYQLVAHNGIVSACRVVCVHCQQPSCPPFLSCQVGASGSSFPPSPPYARAHRVRPRRYPRGHAKAFRAGKEKCIAVHSVSCYGILSNAIEYKPCAQEIVRVSRLCSMCSARSSNANVTRRLGRPRGVLAERQDHVPENIVSRQPVIL